MARPTELTPERHEQIIEAIRNGAYLESAARAAGVSPSTVYLWLERGHRGEEPYSEFLEAYLIADAEAENAVVAVITTKALEGDARAAVAFLERRHRSRWGRFSNPREADDHVRELGRYDPDVPPPSPAEDEEEEEDG